MKEEIRGQREWVGGWEKGRERGERADSVSACPLPSAVRAHYNQTRTMQDVKTAT